MTDTTFNTLIDPICFRATESAVDLALCDVSQGRLVAFRGRLTGPHCKYARTLPASFSLSACECNPSVSQLTQQLVTDPCYWTPALPHLYNVELEITRADNTSQTVCHTIGLRRWEVDGQSLHLERRRTVLRGVVAEAEQDVNLAEAHEAEVAVMVANPSEAFLQQASETGVMVVVDFRGTDTVQTSRLVSLSWQPSVAMALLSDENRDGFYAPPSLTLGQPIEWNATPPQAAAELWGSVLVVTLLPGQRPPAWIAKINKPVVVVRRGETYADLPAARTACDRLQADLAPEFNLAGYFVST